MHIGPQAYHEMQLERVYPSGAEEWVCPACGRRFLVQWQPSYSKLVLEAGDEMALHSGCRGGPGRSPGQGSLPELAEEPEPDEPGGLAEIQDLEGMTDLLAHLAKLADFIADVDQERLLQPYLEWFEQVHFERFWGGDR
jgi:hypothetical protein